MAEPSSPPAAVPSPAAKLFAGLNAHLNTAGAAFDGLTSPVKAQVEQALTKAKADLQTNLTEAEAQLRVKAGQLDKQYEERRVQLAAQFEEQKTKMGDKFEQQKSEVEAKWEAKLDASRALLASAKAEYEAKKGALANAALHEFELVLVKMLDEKVLPAIQEAALDPLMPVFVQELVIDAITAVWPHIKEELFDAWQNMVLKYEPIPQGTPPPKCPNFVRALTASWLYHTYPYNRSMWWQYRRPLWWFFNLVSMFPYWGGQAAYFILLFCALDKNDEFQMVNFILQFKGLQFVTLGLLNCVIAAGSYYTCVSVDYAGDGPVSWTGVAGSGVNLIHDCDQNGPAAQSGFYTDIILFGVQSITIWLAMAWLPSTRKKGVRTLTPDSPPRHFEGSMLAQSVPTAVAGFTSAPVYAAGGGKFRLMVFLDAFLFFLAIAAGVILLFTRPYRVTTPGAFSANEWLFREDVFWLKTLYGLASFPWLVFLLPIVSSLLLHTRATGYTRAGECVPLESGDPPKTEGAAVDDEDESSKVPEVLRRRRAAATMRSVQVGAPVSPATGAWTTAAPSPPSVVVLVHPAADELAPSAYPQRPHPNTNKVASEPLV